MLKKEVLKTKKEAGLRVQPKRKKFMKKKIYIKRLFAFDGYNYKGKM